MRKIYSLILLIFLNQSLLAKEGPMQPATMKYDYCDENGLLCYVNTTEGILGDEQQVASTIRSEVNYNQLLNIDHFYRDQCSNELGIIGHVPKELLNAWSTCLINKMEKMIQARNKENLEYLKNIKESFDQD